MVGGRKVITLCGSTRFKAAWLEWAARLTLEGNVVLTLGWFDPVRRVEPSPEQKALLDEIHLRKIDLADEVFVLDVDRYIGDSTEKEIAYARQAGKKVRFLSQEYPGWTEQDCQLVPGARVVDLLAGAVGRLGPTLDDALRGLTDMSAHLDAALALAQTVVQRIRNGLQEATLPGEPALLSDRAQELWNQAVKAPDRRQ